MKNKWILFLKDYAKRKNISYGCALSQPDIKTLYSALKSSKFTKSYDELYIVEKPARKEPKRIVPVLVNASSSVPVPVPVSVPAPKPPSQPKKDDKSFQKQLADNKKRQINRMKNFFEKYTGSRSAKVSKSFRDVLKGAIRAEENLRGTRNIDSAIKSIKKRKIK